MHLNPITQSDRFHSVEEFVKSVQAPYGLSQAQVNGFIAYAKGKNKAYLRDEKGFVPYLKEYLGK